ncbi:MAG: DUF4442 domain-containing protein [Pseudomonadota bacterium]|nr:DUF4442 domain-containing protein [Pseudomonadota bacterium]
MSHSESSPSASVAAPSLSEGQAAMARKITNPMLFRGWMLAKLPAALFAGVGLREISADRCATTVPYGWRSQNPFKSTYFAALAMAAELSTGALVLLATNDAPFSTLIVNMSATFGKKATGTTTFVCTGGPAVFAAVREAAATGEARAFTLETVGALADGTEVSRFTFTWSVKPRSKKA